MANVESFIRNGVMGVTNNCSRSDRYLLHQPLASEENRGTIRRSHALWKCIKEFYSAMGAVPWYQRWVEVLIVMSSALVLTDAAMDPGDLCQMLRLFFTSRGLDPADVSQMKYSAFIRLVNEGKMTADILLLDVAPGSSDSVFTAICDLEEKKPLFLCLYRFDLQKVRQECIEKGAADCLLLPLSIPSHLVKKTIQSFFGENISLELTQPATSH